MVGEVNYDFHCLKVEKNSSPLAFLEAEIIGWGRERFGTPYRQIFCNLNNILKQNTISKTKITHL